MFLEMPRFGVAPAVHVHNSLMDGAFRYGNAQEALTLYHEMTRLGLCPRWVPMQHCCETDQIFRAKTSP
jgi:pentatricopeptide repeat protein